MQYVTYRLDCCCAEHAEGKRCWRLRSGTSLQKSVAVALTTLKGTVKVRTGASWNLLRSSQNREEPTLKILVHLIDRCVHTPGKMLVQLGARDGKRLGYRTFAVEKNKMAERVFGVIATLLRIVL